MVEMKRMRGHWRWPGGLAWAALASALVALGLGFGVNYFWSLPDNGTDAAGMTAMSLAFMFLMAVGATLALTVLAATRRFSLRKRGHTERRE